MCGFLGSLFCSIDPCLSVFVPEPLKDIQKHGISFHFFETSSISFIKVLSKFHGYSYYNILLILAQYPQATCLTFHKVWEKYMGDSDDPVIKEEYRDTRINLIAPYAVILENETCYALWQRAKMLDISQTNVTRFTPPASIYRRGEEHLALLSLSLRSALSSDHHASVIFSKTLFPTGDMGNPGFREGQNIFCRAGLSKKEQILWLSQNLIDLSEPEKVIGERYKNLFLQLAQHCLLQIWEITDRHMLYMYQDPDLVRSIPKDLRPVFLDLMQRSVRRIEESVYCAYLQLLHDREEELAFIPADT